MPQDKPAIVGTVFRPVPPGFRIAPPDQTAQDSSNDNSNNVGHLSTWSRLDHLFQPPTQPPDLATPYAFREVRTIDGKLVHDPCPSNKPKVKGPRCPAPITREDPADEHCEMWIEALPDVQHRKNRTGRLWLYDAVTGHRRTVREREAMDMALRLNLRVLQDQLKGLEYIPEERNHKNRIINKKNPCDLICRWYKVRKPSEDPTMTRLPPRTDDDDTGANITDSNTPDPDTPAAIVQQVEAPPARTAQRAPLSLVGCRKRKAAFLNNAPRSPPSPPSCCISAQPKPKSGPRKPPRMPPIVLRCSQIAESVPSEPFNNAGRQSVQGPVVRPAEPSTSRSASGPVQFVLLRPEDEGRQPDSSSSPVSSGVSPIAISSSNGVPTNHLPVSNSIPPRASPSSSGVPPLSESESSGISSQVESVSSVLPSPSVSSSDGVPSTAVPLPVSSGVPPLSVTFGKGYCRLPEARMHSVFASNAPTCGASANSTTTRTAPPRISTDAHAVPPATFEISPLANSITPRAVPKPQSRIDAQQVKEEVEDGDQNLMEQPIVRGDGYVPQETCWSVEVYDGRKEKDDEGEELKEGKEEGGNANMKKPLNARASGDKRQETSTRVDAHEVKEEEEEVENLIDQPNGSSDGEVPQETQPREDGHEVKEEDDERNANLTKRPRAKSDGVKHETPSRFSTHAGSDVEERDVVMEEMEENGDAISEQLEDDDAYLGDCENAEDSDQSDDNITFEGDDRLQVRSPSAPLHNEDCAITVSNLTEVVSNVNNRQFAAIPAPLRQLLRSINLEALVDLRMFVRSGGVMGPT